MTSPIAIGAPVRLSVGSLRSRRVPQPGSATWNVSSSTCAMPYLAGPRARLGLAVIAVDNAPAVAQAVVTLAMAESKQQLRIVLADLSAGTPAARRLG